MRSTSVTGCSISKCGWGGRCWRNSRITKAVRSPNIPIKMTPSPIRIVTNARCFVGSISILPFQFEFADRDGVTLLDASLAECLFHTKRFHNLVEAAHGAVMLPICHRCGTFDGGT